jgi:hypothetical protein
MKITIDYLKLNDSIINCRDTYIVWEAIMKKLLLILPAAALFLGATSLSSTTVLADSNSNTLNISTYQPNDQNLKSLNSEKVMITRQGTSGPGYWFFGGHRENPWRG